MSMRGSLLLTLINSGSSAKTKRSKEMHQQARKDRQNWQHVAAEMALWSIRHFGLSARCAQRFEQRAIRIMDPRPARFPWRKYLPLTQLGGGRVRRRELPSGEASQLA